MRAARASVADVCALSRQKVRSLVIQRMYNICGRCFHTPRGQWRAKPQKVRGGSGSQRARAWCLARAINNDAVVRRDVYIVFWNNIIEGVME